MLVTLQSRIEPNIWPNSWAKLRCSQNFSPLLMTGQFQFHLGFTCFFFSISFKVFISKIITTVLWQLTDIVHIHLVPTMAFVTTKHYALSLAKRPCETYVLFKAFLLCQNLGVLVFLDDFHFLGQFPLGFLGKCFRQFVCFLAGFMHTFFVFVHRLQLWRLRWLQTKSKQTTITGNQICK